jgi:hypothetical protein
MCPSKIAVPINADVKDLAVENDVTIELRLVPSKFPS